MGYLVKDGNIYKQLVGVYGDIYLWFVEKAPPRTIHSFSLQIMSRYENENNTDCSAYRYAQRVACCTCVGKDSWSNFIR